MKVFKTVKLFQKPNVYVPFILIYNGVISVIIQVNSRHFDFLLAK